MKKSDTWFPASTNRSVKGKSNRFAVFYGLALTAFLLFVLDESSYLFTVYPLEFVLFSATGGLAIYGQLISLRREASIHFVSFAFCFLFMSIAPIVQVGGYVDPIFQMDHWMLWAAVNSLAFTVIGVLVTYLKTPIGEAQTKPIMVPSDISYLFTFLITVVAAGTTIALFRGSLFTNREEFSWVIGEMFPDSSVMMLARMALFNTPFFGAIVGLRSAILARKGLWIVLFSAALLLAGIVNNPLINPRYQLASLAFFTIDYVFRGRRTKLFAVMLIVGILLAPVFQAFRYGSTDSETPVSGNTNIFSETFLSMDYDAFQLSCYTMFAVNNDGISWGKNLLGAALFFVPRSLWSDKPVQTSWIIFDTIDHARNAGTNNLSTPLMAEGYFAFGWPGALLISFLYWWVISKVTREARKDDNSWLFMVRCVFAGLALIFLRGTLMVGISAIVGSFAAAAIPAFFIKHRFGGGSRHNSSSLPGTKLHWNSGS